MAKVKSENEELVGDPADFSRTEKAEKTEEELKLDFLSSLMEKVIKNPLTRKTQKKYHRASSDCESSDEEEVQRSAYVSVSRDEALKLSLKKLEERKEEERKERKERKEGRRN